MLRFVRKNGVGEPTDAVALGVTESDFECEPSELGVVEFVGDRDSVISSVVLLLADTIIVGDPVAVPIEIDCDGVREGTVFVEVKFA